MSARAPLARTSPVDQLLTIKELSDYIQVPVATLHYWRQARSTEPGPPAIRLGGQLRYRRGDVEVWLAARTDQQPAKPRRIGVA